MSSDESNNELNENSQDIRLEMELSDSLQYITEEENCPPVKNRKKSTKRPAIVYDSLSDSDTDVEHPTENTSVVTSSAKVSLFVFSDIYRFIHKKGEGLVANCKDVLYRYKKKQ